MATTTIIHTTDSQIQVNHYTTPLKRENGVVRSLDTSLLHVRAVVFHSSDEGDYGRKSVTGALTVFMWVRDRVEVGCRYC
jgi:hypothetical protein